MNPKDLRRTPGAKRRAFDFAISIGVMTSIKKTLNNAPRVSLCCVVDRAVNLVVVQQYLFRGRPTVVVVKKSAIDFVVDVPCIALHWSRKPIVARNALRSYEQVTLSECSVFTQPFFNFSPVLRSAFVPFARIAHSLLNRIENKADFVKASQSGYGRFEQLFMPGLLTLGLHSND
ncbi:hypothetical protein CORC01_12212 [Colletotrichum orchidophilum]|uniref:Uncharacterized protein n=1 Tax=Colletotrichum orchidophilum TaxID=1209926 RepID=A0A1G4ATK6_9PEZI|nr:uncharacterized protein CORC01_12212 [Colletotrichum orchidophilum]OHE92494.1 hypothetical protein CORC01_12212 [Colletotrichum orchidophilum]